MIDFTYEICSPMAGFSTCFRLHESSRREYFPLKVRKTLAVGIVAASISAGVAAPAQAEVTTPQTAQVAQAARTEGTPSPTSSLSNIAPGWFGLLLAPGFLLITAIRVLLKGESNWMLP